MLAVRVRTAQTAMLKVAEQLVAKQKLRLQVLVKATKSVAKYYAAIWPV